MIDQYVDLTVLVSTLFLLFSYYLFVLPKMREEMKNHTWNQYFKQCGIYQGKSHWTTIKTIIFRLNRKNT
jgi:hypothetical protein